MKLSFSSFQSIVQAKFPHIQFDYTVRGDHTYQAIGIEWNRLLISVFYTEGGMLNPDGDWMTKFSHGWCHGPDLEVSVNRAGLTPENSYEFWDNVYSN